MMLVACLGFVVAAVIGLGAVIINGRSDSAPNPMKTRVFFVIVGIITILYAAYKLYASF